MHECTALHRSNSYNRNADLISERTGLSCYQMESLDPSGLGIEMHCSQGIVERASRYGTARPSSRTAYSVQRTA